MLGSTDSGSSLPEVSVPQSRLGPILFALAMVGLAIALFVGLESARMARVPDSEIPTESGEETILRSASSDDLVIPPTVVAPGATSAPLTAFVPQAALPPVSYIAPSGSTSSRPPASPRYDPVSAPFTYTAPWTAPPPIELSPGPSPTSERTIPGAERVTSQRIRNLSSTVVQGTLVRAVLESALDSTRPGQARALVTRDVKGFDGTRVLIPRGSRLFGDYGAEVSAGQNRLMIRWSRLILPSGVSIALDSPVADPLGRAGVRAKVDSHLMTRIGNALVDGSASLGSTLLGRRLGSSNQVIVALPGAVQGTAPAASKPITPTLKVKQGERISVFVAHDLDFAEDAQ